MKADSSTSQNQTPEAVAIVGMGCVYPGASTPDELWENVLAGRRFIRQAPPERMPSDYFDPDPLAVDKSYCNLMATVSGWEFDPLKFSIPPVTYEASDMAHWLALHTAHSALEDSGLDLVRLDRSKAAVILGNTLAGEFMRAQNVRFRWPYVERALRRSLAAQGINGAGARRILEGFQESCLAPFPEISEDSLAGNMSNTIAGRVSNHFDFGGGAFVVDGACSSSLLSVALACDALSQKSMDLVLAGGVDISLDPFEIVGFAKAQALAREDIRPYDRRANGTVTGEGCGIVVLMRESDARDLGLKIHALMRGWAYSSDGTGGITSPEIEGQARALRRAYQRAGYPMTSVGLIEGHGTGTPLGDRVELTALQQVLQSEGGDFQCRIGSIKANLGHCKAAAGAAGLIKAIQAIRYKILPPTVNCSHPSEAFSQSGWRLRPSRGEAWKPNGTSRRASVSAMGFGGANAHVTLEEAEPSASPLPRHLDMLESEQASELLLLAAADRESLLEQVRKLIPITQRLCRAELTDMAAALAKRPLTGRCRLAIVAQTPWDLTESLRLLETRLSRGEALKDVSAPDDGVFAGEVVAEPTWVALFPGQGSQRLNMTERYYRRFPFVRDLYLSLRPDVREWVRRDTLAATPQELEEWNSQLRATQVAQPALVASSMATLEVLEFFGLKPALSLGHSLGEISALCAAGAMEPRCAVELAAQRGQAMSSLELEDPGSMVALSADLEVVKALIEPYGDSLVVANHNSPRQVVVSGRTGSVKQLARAAEHQDVRATVLPVSHAFHSSLVAPAARQFRENLAKVEFNALKSEIISSSTATAVRPEDDIRGLLAQQLCGPVRFVQAVKESALGQPALWVEVGPGSTLSSLVRDILGPDQVLCLPTDLADEDSFHLLNQVLAGAFVAGLPVATDKLFSHRFHRPFDLDNFDPKFIVNPCERPVQLRPSKTQSNLGGWAPDGVDSQDFEAYLTARGDFLREMIELDYRHHTASTRSLSKPAPPPLENKAQVDEEIADAPALLDFAVEWISKRTGFPPEAIDPDKRLRSDLNLDSIKVAELAVRLARRTNRQLRTDPGALANATLNVLVQTILDLDGPMGGAAEHSESASTIWDTPGLDNWVRTFGIGEIPAPLNEETSRPFPQSGTVVVLDGGKKGEFCALLKSRGLSTLLGDSERLEELADISEVVGAVLFLPRTSGDLTPLSRSAFQDRVEGLAARLYRFFRWVPDVHSIVIVREASAQDDAIDLDAGAALLRSLQFEGFQADLKWLVLPSEWSERQAAETVWDELNHTGKSVVRHHPDGVRVCQTALAPTAVTPEPPPLGNEDVALVSGGGKGITFELALELSRTTGCKLALLGSSPPPTESETSELAENLKRLREAGVAHGYYQADVTDGQAVRSAAALAGAELGTITAILHGAGVSPLGWLKDKPLDDFLHCIRVKTLGLYNLLSAAPPEGLKALHVLSSVLGYTGFGGQTDYTFANAWLAAAVQQIHASHPNLHCLSLGYSVWQETGLGHRLGTVEKLRASGMNLTPISVAEGVAAYGQLLQARPYNSRFVITGRLAFLEPNLFTPPKQPALRFRQKILRQIPGTEFICEANLSHRSDLYLPEHVYQGTALFPGVMALEAMVQAATATLGTSERPVLREIRFSRPLIVPEGDEVKIRILALAEPPQTGARNVMVAIRSEGDGFQQSHFQARCLFGLSPVESGEVPLPPASSEWSVEEFSPLPLFQGKFFRRIRAIRKLESKSECWTEIRIPEGERYYADGSLQVTSTLSPAARDAFLQTGALTLPPGYLPESFQEWSILSPWRAGQLVYCHAVVRGESERGILADFNVYDSSGKLLERLAGGLFRPASRPGEPPQPPGPLSWHEVEEFAKGAAYGLAVVRPKAEVAAPGRSARDRETAGNLAAARRAVVQIATDRSVVTPSNIVLEHRSDGKPILSINGNSILPDSLDISISDGHGLSLAAVGRGRVGVDLEAVEVRDCETWRALLGDEGYTLALDFERLTHERFDLTATRVWTLIEAVKKAFGSCPTLPQMATAEGNVLNLSLTIDGTECSLHSFAVEGNIAVALVLAADLKEQSFLDGILSRFHEEQDVSAIMRDLLGGLTEIRRNSTQESWDAFCERCFHHPLTPLVQQDPMTRRCSLKPRGYAGDAGMLDFMYKMGEYENALSQTTELGRRLYDFTGQSPASLAVHRRLRVIAEAVRRTAAAVKSPRLLSVACGYLREAELCSDLRVGRWLALDQDKASLEVVRANHGLSVETVEASINQILMGQTTFEPQHLIYSAGLYDYLTEWVARELTAKLFSFLAPGGTLLLANFQPEPQEIGFMEAFMRWKLIYRTPQQMLELSADIPAQQLAQKCTFEEAERNLVFLELTRGT